MTLQGRSGDPGFGFTAGRIRRGYESELGLARDVFVSSHRFNGVGHQTHISRPMSGGNMDADERWQRLENIVRKVIREELQVRKTSNICILDGKWSGISEAQLSAWKEAYPAVDVGAELKNALAWCLSNPNEAPRSRFGSFLNTWFRRNQDRSALRSIPVSRPATFSRPCDYCGKPSNGSANGYHHCREHTDDALYHVQPSDLKTRSAGA